MSEEVTEINNRSRQVDGLLASKNKSAALALALQTPSINTKSEEIKVTKHGSECI